MRRIFVLVLTATAATIGVTQAAWAQPLGTVQYAYHSPYVYPQGPFAPGFAQGRTSITASFDGCAPGASPAGCEWYVEAVAVATGCSADPDSNPYPYEVWRSVAQTANGAVRSGEQAFEMGTPNELELTAVCLYMNHGPAANWHTELVHVRNIDPEPAVASQPDPGSPPAITSAQPAPSSAGPPAAGSLTLTGVLARKASRARLAKRFGSWRGAARRSVTCRRGTGSASARYLCTATWRYRGKQRRAGLTVVVRNNRAVAQLR